MTAVTPETAPLRHPDTSLQDRQDISLARVYLPFAMVIVFGVFLAVAGYTVGGIMFWHYARQNRNGRSG